MLEESNFNFIGNIEGRDLFNDMADVIVCDGFTGNVILKLAESFYELTVRKGFQDSFFDRFNYEQYGGSPILGVNASVVVGHGISSPEAIKNMILLCQDLVNAKLTHKIRDRSEEHTSELQSLMRTSYDVFCLKKKKLINI